MTASTGNVPGRIFMSYRRDDTDYPAAWLFRELAEHFGRDQVFKDVDSIELGDDFIEVITNAVASCHVLLALIGRRWLTVTGQDGRRRLDSPNDFVRLEIEAALARNVRVIPVLVEAAQMPRADELPASLAKLVRRQALELSSARFDLDTQRLLRALDRTIAEAQGRARPEAAVRVGFGDVHPVTGSDRPVSAVAFSPDGRLACGADDGTVRLWDLATGTLLTTLTGHRGAVHEVAFSRDGRRAATAADDGTVRLWDLATGAQVATLTGWVSAVAFSPDGRRIATGAGNGTVRLWDPATGTELDTRPRYYAGVFAVAFSPDGRWLASADAGGAVRLWDPGSRTEQAVLTGHDRQVWAVAFSPDGRRVASAGADGTVRLWDPATGTEQAVLTGHDSRVFAAAFSPDGRWLASAGEDWTVRLWDCEAMGALSVLRLDAPIKELTWSRETIALRKEGSVVLLDVVTPK